MKRHRFVLAIGLALAAVAGSSLVRADSNGGCVIAQVDSPILLPDGSEHPAGLLRLCVGSAFSPVSVFQKTYVGGRAVGYFRSRSRLAEADPGGPPLVTFLRADGGRLALAGYALPTGRRTVAYIFEDAWRNVSRSSPAISQDGGPPSSVSVAAVAGVR